LKPAEIATTQNDGGIPMPDTVPHTTDDIAELDALLSPDALTALMRSTWTWDDRALRRDLSRLLVDLGAAQLIAGDSAFPAFGEWMAARAHADGASFVATVLGPKLIADTGNPLRPHYLDMALNGTEFAKQAHRAATAAADSASDYLRTRLADVDYAAEGDWTALVRDSGAEGLGAAMRAYGRARSDSPFFGAMALAWQAVDGVARSEEAASLAQRLLAGEIVGTVAAAEQTGSWDPALVRLRAQPTDDGWRLTGEKSYVPAAAAVDVVLVIGRSVAGPSLFAVDAGSSGLTIVPHDVTDPSRPLFGVTFDDTPATLLGVEGGGGRLMSQLIDRATTSLAAEQVGVIEAAIELLRDAQADNDSRAADVALAHAAAYATWRHALTDPAPETAAAAHLVCSAAALRATSVVAEICEPDGATTALVDRALSASLLFGGPALSHERLLERLGI
jgi:alkylation response protein AidB-like acyl-CoA dehydrogenase